MPPQQFRRRASTWDSENPHATQANLRKASTGSVAAAARVNGHRKSSAAAGNHHHVANSNGVTVLPMHVAVRHWNSRDGGMAAAEEQGIDLPNGGAAGAAGKYYGEYLSVDREDRV